MKNFRKACRGEKGFTLIELLVVIIILGVLAAVVTLAVTRFIGKGTLESANAELVTVQAAVESALAEGNSETFDGAGPYLFTGANDAGNPTIASENTSVYVQMRTHTQKATYTITKGGDITSATCAAAGQWGPKITWDTTLLKWKKA